MIFSVEHKTFMTEFYFRNGVAVEGNDIIPVVLFHKNSNKNFHFIVADFYNVVRNIVLVFRKTGSVHHKKGAAPPTLHINEVIEDVEERNGSNPSASLRHLSQEVGLSVGTCHKIVKKSSTFYNYNLLMDLTFFSDEAWFHLSGTTYKSRQFEIFT
ncbi:hypothetical protein Zmor_021582 [Zophobas morio]|uniref:Uncharacterized protein n=1 Tax=Zophobas morio TaxID=2755281 RepID=A0AA38I6M5_9CUCU|nr:hypothetical protein Zmor_021582 [Zophobas morio]